MATQTQTALLERKLDLLRDMLALTQRELLLVDLEGLTPLLERKDELIDEMRGIDDALQGEGELPQDTLPLQREMAEVVRAVLENERTLEARLEAEQERLRREMSDVGRQGRVRRYLEQGKRKGGRINLKR